LRWDSIILASIEVSITQWIIIAFVPRDLC